MYVVFDLDNGQASIAQANLNSTAAPDIVTVAAGPTGVAAAVSGVNTAPVNSFSIAAGVTTATNSYVASTVSPIAQATGAGAIPAGAQEAGEDGGKSGEGSKAAAALTIPTADWTAVWVVGVWSVCIAMGMGVMM